MIAIKFVKEQYSKMADHELTILAGSDGKDLNSEALTALYQEFLKRKLDTSLVSALRIEKINEHLERQREAQEANSHAFRKQIWSHCFAARLEGESDYAIFQELIQMGLSPEVSDLFVSFIDFHANEIIKELDNEKFTGGFIAILAIIGTLFLIVNNLSGMSLVFTIVAAILGFLRYSTSADEKRKMERVLVATEMEVSKTG